MEYLLAIALQASRAHEDGTPESPRWLIERHSSENDGDPRVHEFDDGRAALAHIGQHASMSDEEGEGR